ncbi:MAG: DUF6587 family protein [Gammaproteobacteria bacterium]
MEAVLQTLIVAIIVLASSVFAAWRLSPARLKLRLLDSVKPDTAHVWGRWIAGLRAGVAGQLAHGCSACARAPTHIQKHKAG